MFLERKNRVAFAPSEVVDILMGEARKKFPEDVPEAASVTITVDIDDATGDEVFKLTWKSN